jgi:hypothetical protein
VLLRALAKEPGARYPTAEALGEVAAAEATRVMAAVPTKPVERETAFNSPIRDAPPSPPATGKFPSPAAWAAGILVAFGLVGLLLLSSFRGSGDRASGEREHSVDFADYGRHLVGSSTSILISGTGRASQTESNAIPDADTGAFTHRGATCGGAGIPVAEQ